MPLAAENSDIPTDPAVTWGVLDCGMRYAILPNPEPKGRLSLRLHVDAGSLVETEKQRGASPISWNTWLLTARKTLLPARW